MQAALRLNAWIQPGGKIEITDAQLPVGKPAEVIILFPQATDETLPSAVDVLAQAPGHLAFHNVEEVDAYLQEERDAWEH